MKPGPAGEQVEKHVEVTRWPGYCSEAGQEETAGPHFLPRHILVLMKKAGVPQAGKGHVARRQQGQRAKSDSQGGGIGPGVRSRVKGRRGERRRGERRRGVGVGARTQAKAGSFPSPSNP